MFSVGKERWQIIFSNYGPHLHWMYLHEKALDLHQANLIVPVPWPSVFLFQPFLITPLFNMIASFHYAAPQLSYLRSLTFQPEFWILVWLHSFGFILSFLFFC